MGNLNSKSEKPQACLTNGCYPGCHTRWRGLEFHLLVLRSSTAVYERKMFMSLPFGKYWSNVQTVSETNFSFGLTKIVGVISF